MLAEVLDVALPDAGFYLWAGVPSSMASDTTFASRWTCSLSTMWRCCPAACWRAPPRATTRAPAASGWHWWPSTAECLEAAQRIVAFTRTFKPRLISPWAQPAHDHHLQNTIDTAWEEPRQPLRPPSDPQEVREAVDHVIGELNAGRLRVATRSGVGQWTPTSGSRRPCC
jgi:hypothetical protein